MQTKDYSDLGVFSSNSSNSEVPLRQSFFDQIWLQTVKKCHSCTETCLGWSNRNSSTRRINVVVCCGQKRRDFANNYYTDSFVYKLMQALKIQCVCIWQVADNGAAAELDDGSIRSRHVCTDQRHQVSPGFVSIQHTRLFAFYLTKTRARDPDRT